MDNNDKDLTAQYFLSACSHELRTPLNGIVGYTQLLLQTKLDSMQRSYLCSMNQCCTQLLQLINDILDFSKLATGKMKINNECFSINDIVTEVNSALSYRIKEKKQKCCYILSKTLPELIVCDKTKITQILVNLVSNANKFTSIGGRIIVNIWPEDPETILFSVEDNGIGISIQEQEKLFDAFYQVQESLTKNGSGLGLAICKKLIQLLQGKITVESEKNNGTVFTFSVRYEQYEKFQQQVEHNSKILHNKYILIVDDNIDNRLILSEILFQCFMKPIVCSSAKEGLRLISHESYPFSVGLIDICMPDMSGTDLAQQMKEINPDLPLVALSSLDEPIVSNCFETILNKPVHKIRLLDCLSRILSKDSITDCVLQPNNEDEEKITARKEARILVAEDISYNLDMLIKMLENIGYCNIDTVTDGEKAIVKIDNEYERKTPYDILLLDLKMPKIDGFSVAEHIRARGYAYPKIAVLTASVVEADRERCRRLGIKYFILKPINMTHLKIVLKHLSSETGPQISLV
jgi:CheY-like chemotaxis protein